MDKHDIDELNRVFSAGETCDSALFSEMRTNVLLHIGEHFKNTSEKIIGRLSGSALSEEQKLKLAINHIQCVTKIYKNNLLAMIPNVHFAPKNEKENGDVKDAELSQSVWEHLSDQMNFKEKRNDFLDSFSVIGEMIAFVYWDKTKGKFLGMRQETGDDGELLYNHPVFGKVTDSVDEMGMPLEPSASDDAVFSGEMCLDQIYPPNLIRPENTEKLSEAEWLCVRKNVSVSTARALIETLPKEEYEKKEKFISASSSTTQTVLDGNRAIYTDEKGKCELRYYYFRKSPVYPEGYYYITAGSDGILLEGTLPGGIFPIITEKFDDIPTSPRGRSIIKPLRPIQIEINRMASARAMNSINFQDTKVFLHSGTKMTNGERVGGMRKFYINGPMPEVKEGSAAVQQFTESIGDAVKTMYQLANLDYENQSDQSTDPTSIIYRSKAQQKKYTLYAQKVERFFANIAQTTIELAKIYLEDNEVIRAVGRSEAINIPEFKMSNQAGIRVKALPVSGDPDDLFLKHLTINQALQYGGDLPPHIRQMLITELPFLNKDHIAKDLTLTITNIESDILALDRGEFRQAFPDDDHALYIQKLRSRTKSADFRMLNPQIQQMYQQKIQQHEEMQADQIQKMKAMEESFIPNGPPFVKCDLYENVKGADGKLTNKVVKAVYPMGALLWLRSKLDAQGQTQAMLESLNNKQDQLDILIRAGLLQPGMMQMPEQMQLQQQGMNHGPVLNAQSQPA